MTAASFAKQIGPSGKFYAYGEAILLDVIRKEDLRSYEGQDQQRFQELLDEFTKNHKLPDVFEYVITSNDPAIRWKTTPLSSDLSERYLPEELRRNTNWFVVYWPNTADFHVEGEFDEEVDQAERENQFVLLLQAEPEDHVEQSLAAVK